MSCHVIFLQSKRRTIQAVKPGETLSDCRNSGDHQPLRKDHRDLIKKFIGEMIMGLVRVFRVNMKVILMQLIKIL